jgi:hypothetical protein
MSSDSETHVVATKGGPIQHDATNRVFQHDVSAPSIRDPIETMPNNSFSSSNVHSGLFDFGASELFLRFLRDGPDAIYIYFDVPTSVWQSLRNARSKGSFVNSSIAFKFRYAKSGRGDFPDRKAIASDALRRFVYDP